MPSLISRRVGVLSRRNGLKVNVDASVAQLENSAACGGVIRNEQEEFVSGFAAGLGACLVIDKRALIKGLQHAWNAGFRRVIIETDSMEAVALTHPEEAINYLHRFTHRSGPTNQLVEVAKALISREWAVQIYYVNRNWNAVADTLAKIFRGIGVNSLTFCSAPSVIHGGLHEDKLRVPLFSCNFA